MDARWCVMVTPRYPRIFSQAAIEGSKFMVKKTRTGMPAKAGPLIIIGGHEDKQGDRLILAELAKHAAGGTLLVMTLASQEGNEQWKEYRRVFTELGAKKVEHFDMESRAEADE